MEEKILFVTLLIMHMTSAFGKSGQLPRQACSVGGLVCETYCKRIEKDRSYEVIDLLCKLTDKAGSQQFLKIDKSGRVLMKGDKPGRLMKKRDKGERVKMKGYKLRRVTMKRDKPWRIIMKGDKQERDMKKGDKQGRIARKGDKPGRIAMKGDKSGHRKRDSEQLPESHMKFDLVYRNIKTSVGMACLTSVDSDEKRADRTSRRPTETNRHGYRGLGVGKEKIYVKRFDNTATWHEALRICRSESAALVKIDTAEKMKQISKHVCESGDKLKRFNMWIGLRDFDKKNVFEWLDRSPCNFSQWHKDEPTLTHGNTEDKYCVAIVAYLMLHDGNQWSNRYCGNKYGFICEIATNYDG